MIPKEFTKGLPNSTKEEMNAIAAKAHDGDKQARHDLGELMQPFVIGYVRTIKGDYSREQRNEITQAAWLGVAEALDRWREGRGPYTGAVRRRGCRHRDTGLPPCLHQAHIQHGLTAIQERGCCIPSKTSSLCNRPGLGADLLGVCRRPLL